MIGRRGNSGVYSGGGDKDVSNQDQIEEHRVSTQKSYNIGQESGEFSICILEHFKDLLQPGDTEWIS